MPQPTHRLVRRGLLAAGGTLLAGAIAGKFLWPGNAALPAPEPAAPALQPISALRAHAPTALPPQHFVRADGTSAALSDYAGRGVVLNFWATWCTPCVAEMAALERLARALAARRVAVLPVSEDHGGADAVRPFYAGRGIRDLPILLDPHMQAMAALQLDGIPTTLVIDRTGHEVARIQGAVHWDAPDAADVIGRMVGT